MTAGIGEYARRNEGNNSAYRMEDVGRFTSTEQGNTSGRSVGDLRWEGWEVRGGDGQTKARILESQNAQLEAMVRNLQDQLELSRRRADESTLAELSKLQVQVTQLRSECDAMRMTNADLAQGKMLLTAEVEMLRADQQSVRGKYESRSQSAEAELLNLLNNNQELDYTSKRLQQELTFLDHEVRSRSEEVSQLRAQLQEVVSQAELQAQQQEVASVSRVVELSAQRDSAINSARRTSERLREAEAKLESMQQALTAEVEQLKKENHRLSTLMRSHEASQNEAFELRKELRDLMGAQA
ncbi:hypothetical protein GUITHDRAFT_106126 [Guillardia theta CCMP2712]|uniref:Uncharacterized protein n=1 Tax=Guillardia theta (strain CCMP2712) TaxID=905079 RepID=L1JIR5_GUITC|nr:hypothetical protein GUITHDRAFT_106126 [Guillardia theta CCMP2712]EKX48044.1 hypothetical protein GUITHDRAFT_106126 [Guillardia theta CCMP2712]|eukprot:XP_005835024.1 hypothetical protein GUITHDRAFT_106126 [Guillardia theta CCMP2712]